MLSQDPANVLNDLYNDLQIQALLQRQEAGEIKENGHGGHHWRSTGARSSWQKYVDDLCFLCDNQRAGKTTTSIAVEERFSRHIMWITANAGDLESAKYHLREVVQLVLGDESEKPKADRVEGILKKTIARSSQRVSNYASRLRNALAKLEQTITRQKTKDNTNGKQIRQ